MLHSMYGNEPVHWKDEFSGSKRIRVIINAFTRMRMCNSHGHMEFSHKGAPTHDADGLMPWLDMPGRALQDDTIVFGHWSTLGLRIRTSSAERRVGKGCVSTCKSGGSQ